MGVYLCKLVLSPKLKPEPSKMSLKRNRLKAAVNPEFRKKFSRMLGNLYLARSPEVSKLAQVTAITGHSLS